MELLFGLISGVISGMGMGGGTILILLLSLFLNLEQHVAQATNLIFFIPTSIAAIIINIKNKNVNKRIAILISCVGIVGAVIGSIIADKLHSEHLRRYFAIFILIIALHEIYQMVHHYIQNKKIGKKT